MQFVDLRSQHEELEPALSETIARVIRDSAFVGGPDVEEFESRFSSLTGVRHCISCANGTDALYIALRALGAGPGDEVITTAHSWIATSATITQTGAQVVFADTEADTFCIDPVELERKVSPRTKGIIAVHLYGQPADMVAVTTIARDHGLWLIEDCAQAHIAEFEGRMVGGFGDIATFSFYPGKNLGAMGDAGCLVTNRDDLAEFAALFARHGGKNGHVIEGINSRLDGVQAAVLNLKIAHLDRWTSARIDRAETYDRLFEKASLSDRGILAPAKRPGVRHVYHLYVIKTLNRDALRSWLQSKGVPTGIHYLRPLPLYKAYERLCHGPEDFPNASRNAEEILSLPMHPYLSEDQQAQVVEALMGFGPAALGIAKN